jgi:hypothetical protein
MDTRCLRIGRLALAVVAIVALAAPAGAQTQSQPQVKIERGERTGQTPLWLPVRVTVTEAGGAPFGDDHLVFVLARNTRGDEAGPFELGTLELESPSRRGVHEGFVIVPYGGTWTVTATVNEARADSGAPAALLGRGSADLVVDAPVPPEGAAATTSTDSGSAPASEPVKVGVLWVHNLAAILWGLAIALLALLALPAGRRFLSESGTTLLDGRLDKIARGAWWLTGLVVATGIYNLVNSVAYRVPLSPDQASRLFRLPYAQPYYLSLTVKLLTYAVLIGATVPLIREARRRAATAGAAGGEGSTVVLDDDPSPWANPQRRSEGDQGAGGRVALRRRTAAQVAVEEGWAPDDGGRPATGLVALMIAGAAVIITAVTLLKYFHLLGEVSRLTG